MNKPLEMNRAYSVLTVKTVDAEQRRISGIATTPTPDRMGDIVEPLGIEFKNPMPLLWQHDARKPVGEVRFKKPTEDGIEFDARITDPAKAESPALKDRLQEAWDSVKLGLVRGVSIGFIPMEFNFMKDGGLRIEKSEVMELSLVTIPANAEATIMQIKSADLRAALGTPVRLVNYSKTTVEDHVRKALAEEEKILNHTVASDRIDSNIAPATREKINAPVAQKEKAMPRTVAERISAFEAKRAANVARMAAIMDEADDKTLEDSAKEEFDTLQTENKEVDDNLIRLRTVELQNKQAAVPVVPADEERKIRFPGLRTSTAPISVKPNVPKGTGFTRLAMAMAAGKGSRFESIAICKQNMNSYGWDNTPEVLQVLEHNVSIADMLMQRAVQQPGTTTDSTWAAPLVTYNVLASEFIELLRPATIIGNIPNLRRVPFNIQMPATTSGTSVGWVGEGAPKPVSAMAFTTVTLRWAKAAGIVVLTDELVRFSNPSAEAVVRADLIAAMAQFLDRQFIDPAVAEVTNVSPASITNGVAAVTPTGTNEAAFRTDVKTLLNTFLTNNLSTAGGVWIMTQQQALALSLMINALGQLSFPTITPTGGTLLGYPVVASENIPSTTGSPTEGYPIIFAVAPEIMLADDGQVTIDASNQASIQMESTPDSPPTGSTLFQSLWQANMTALRAERYINWKKRRSTSVGYIQSAKYA